MEVRPIVILSLGASNWGANDPAWTGWDIVSCLNRAGIGARPAALALGGAADRGLDMDETGRASLRRTIAGSGLPFVEADGLETVVAARLRIYDQAAAGRPLRAFINVGGSWADMGDDPEVLKLKPGFNPAGSVSVPPPERRGLIGAMAGRGVPIVHLLYVKGLADRYGLPWDPMPLPGPEGRPSRTGGPGGWGAPAAAVYLAGLAVGLVFILRSRRAALRG
jgi:poly-gamma-glutamate system protein